MSQELQKQVDLLQAEKAALSHTVNELFVSQQNVKTQYALLQNEHQALQASVRAEKVKAEAEKAAE